MQVDAVLRHARLPVGIPSLVHNRQSMDIFFGDGENHVLLNIGTNLSFAGFSSRGDPFFDVFRRATLDGIMPFLESAILIVFTLK